MEEEEEEVRDKEEGKRGERVGGKDKRSGKDKREETHRKTAGRGSKRLNGPVVGT